MSGREGYVPGMTGRGEALNPVKNETTALQEQEDSPMPDIKEENLDPASAEYELYPPVGPINFEEPKYLFRCTPTDEGLEYWAMIKDDGSILYLKEERGDGQPYMDRGLLKMIKEEQIRNMKKYIFHHIRRQT
ncbi:MAG: hypothetical protein Q9212_000767 [Teloschistes hypoglaucus]